jgi:hypothetical protein
LVNEKQIGLFAAFLTVGVEFAAVGGVAVEESSGRLRDLVDVEELEFLPDDEGGSGFR